MSVFRDCELICPRCARAWVAPLAVSVNGDRSPDVRRAILEGRFQVMTCPSCGGEMVADGPLLYIEFEARRFIGCQPRGWLPAWRELEHEAADTWRRTFVEHAPAAVRATSTGFVVRTVFGLPALREKLLCFDAGLDDRLVEALKLDLMRTPGAGLTLDPRARLILVAVEDDRLMFEVGGRPGEQLAVPRGRYGAIVEGRRGYADLIARLTAGPFVDVARLMVGGTAPRPAR